MAVAAGALELLTRGRRFPVSLRWTLRAIVLALIAAACARNMIAGSWSGTTSAVWIAGFTLLILAAVFVLEKILDRTRGFTAPALLLIIVGGASQILAVGYSSLKLGQSVGVVAAILGAACGISLLRPQFSLALGGVLVPIAIASAAVLVGDITTDARLLLYTTCIVAAMLLPGLTLLKPLKSLQGRKRSLTLLTLAGIPIAAALAVAAVDELNRESTEEDEYSVVTTDSNSRPIPAP